jgi:Undecaprenyl-phosphate glucose phosphotransferase
MFILDSVFFAALLIALRLMVVGLRKKYRHRIRPLSNIFVLGDKQVIEKIYDSINQGGGVSYNLLGVFSSSDITPNGHPASLLYKGNLSDCIQLIREQKVQEILCSVKEFPAEDINRLIDEADRQMIRVKLLLDYESILNKQGEISAQFNIPILTLRREPLEEERNKIIKRTFDIFFSALALILIMSWLTPLLMLLIWLESKGNPIFVQLRSGKNNQAFKCYKFRSMRVNNGDAAKQATKDDNRITKIGAFMRRTNIDEFPQFWNVLIGDMSIVGPRPHMLAHTKYYKTLLDDFMVRHFMKPGITGWAQVNGCRGETRTVEAMEARVKYDIEYMEKWSFFLDMKIIFLTIWKTFKGDEKAY